MPSIIMRFPGRRYHATPWGHHVNEGLVEWPPSPWRLVRALLSVGYTKGIWNGDNPSETARNLIAKLSGTLPEYSLPGAVGAHSRHYMPTSRLKSGNEDKTLVFDTWARVEDGELVVFWDVALEQDEQSLLGELVARLGYLGRAESWVEARLARTDEQVPEINCRPDDTPPLPGWEQVALLAPQAGADYGVWRQAAEESIDAKLPPLDDTEKVTKAQLQKLMQQRSKALEPYPNDLLDALQKDTAWWRGHGWSQPPGSRRVFYQRPKDALVVGPPSVRVIPAAPPVRAMLLALATSTGNKQALPPVTMTLYQGERLHKRLVGLAEGYNRALSGCDENGAPLGGRHEHAHFLALDLDADGHLDHFLIWSPMGLNGAAQRAVRALRKTYAKGVKELRLALAASTPDLNGLRNQQGEHGEKLQALLGLEGTTEWISQTPFVPPRHMKPRGRNTLTGQVRAELATRGLLDDVQVTVVDPRDDQEASRHRHFRRNRQNGPLPPVDCGFTLRLTFDQPVSGPLCLGYGSHYGLGMFKVCS